MVSLLWWVWVVVTLLLAVLLVRGEIRRRRRLAPPPYIGTAGIVDEHAWLKFYETALHALASRDPKSRDVDPVLLAVRTTRSAAGFASAALEAYRDRWPSSSAPSPGATSPKTSTTPPAKRPPPPSPSPSLPVFGTTAILDAGKPRHAAPPDTAKAMDAQVTAMVTGALEELGPERNQHGKPPPRE